MNRTVRIERGIRIMHSNIVKLLFKLDFSVTVLDNLSADHRDAVDGGRSVLGNLLGNLLGNSLGNSLGNLGNQTC